MASEEHLYRFGAEPRERRKFEAEYGKERGDRIYPAVVGKVRRERMCNKRHSDESHHVGSCSPACKRGEIYHSHRRGA